MSLRTIVHLFVRRALMPALLLLTTFPAYGQYPGQVSKNAKDAPALRSIAVLEWTGPEEKPKASRLVPVLVYDNGQMQDGSIYLARPEPMAVAPEVEYELQEKGKPVGLFDVQTSGQQLGSWVGFGAWKPVPNAPRTPPKPTLPEWGMDNQEGDRPVLHRKKHADEASTSGASTSGQASGGQAPAAPSDPDRPVLHKSKSAEGDDPSAGASSPGASSAGAAGDSDRPVLHKKDSDSDSTASSSAPSDPDRPVLKKTKKAPPSDIADVSSVPGSEDPDRPRLKRGLANMDDLKVLPSLIGLPPDLEQSVAVSDAKNRPQHPFGYNWSDPAVESKMKSSLEDIAREDLGLKPPPTAPKAKTTTAAQRAAAARRTAKPAPPVEPAPLMDERFSAFELTYGSEATLVLTAHTDAPPAHQKFVTLIAQPDFYGNVQVMLKTVTDAAHLDDNPRLRLVDAVDALGDNRGELLFEMRGATQRQFALYRIGRGQAEKLFVTGGGQFGEDPNN